MHFVVEKANDENDGGLGGATKMCRRKKDNANKEGPSENKPKVCFRHCVYIILYITLSGYTFTASLSLCSLWSPAL